MTDLYVGSPQLVLLELLNDAMPLSINLRGYRTENENPRGRKPRGIMRSLHSQSHLIQGLLENWVTQPVIHEMAPWG